MVLKIAEISIPAKETVIILLVKMGKLKDSMEKLNLLPPKKIGSQPSTKSNNEAVAQDQYPSMRVYEWETFFQNGIFLFCKKP